MPETYELLLENDILNSKYKELEGNFNAVEQFLGEFQLLMPNEIELKIAELQKNIKTRQTELNTIKQNLRANPRYNDPIRDDILRLENELDEKRQEHYYTKQTLQNYLGLENQLLEDLDKSAQIQISAAILSSFEFTQCPRCLQAITEEMQYREYHGDCSLCGRALSLSSDKTDDVEIYRKQIEFQLSELDTLKGQYQEKVTILEKQIDELNITLANKRVEFDNTVSVFVAPLVQNIEILNRNISNASRDIQLLEEQRKWRSQLQSMYDKLLAIDRKKSDVQKEIASAREKEEAAKNQIVHLEKFLRHFISDIYPEAIDKININRKDFLPSINGYKYNSRSATEKNIAILGYQYALLKFALECDSYIPRFLVIDTLRQDDLDDQIYEKVLIKFKELSDVYTDKFQMFLVIRDEIGDLRNHVKHIITDDKLLMV